MLGGTQLFEYSSAMRGLNSPEYFVIRNKGSAIRFPAPRDEPRRCELRDCRVGGGMGELGAARNLCRRRGECCYNHRGRDAKKDLRQRANSARLR